MFQIGLSGKFGCWGNSVYDGKYNIDFIGKEWEAVIEQVKWSFSWGMNGEKN